VEIFAGGTICERLFKGEDASETLAAVIKEEPNLNAVPVRVRHLLQSNALPLGYSEDSSPTRTLKQPRRKFRRHVTSWKGDVAQKHLFLGKAFSRVED
jgi:hypothetical protein